MKVGILTLHSQLNYGGVLQAFALQTALEQMGHKVVVIDRWWTPRNESLRGPFAGMPLRAWVRWGLRGLAGCGQFGSAVRHLRTMRFVRKRLHLTPYHFRTWQEMAGRELGVDCIVVGSDQVWHCGDWGDPEAYLLEGAPEYIPAIAYAASFGLREIPESFRELYRRGFQRFSAIGVREAEGVTLVESLGAKATHVVDPTQLLDAATWKQCLALKPTGKRRRLVCYFLSENVQRALPELETFARETDSTVEVYVNSFARPMPKSVSAVLARLKLLITSPFSRVHVRLAAGPREFVQSFASTTWICSDSFHALMFASIFDKQVAILRPSSPFRAQMFARIEEFVASSTTGPVIEPSLSSALARFKKGNTTLFIPTELTPRHAASLHWLIDSLCNEQSDTGSY